VQDETNRVQKIAKQKKKLSDPNGVTCHLLERMVMISNERLTSQMLAQDDFNYAHFNPKIFNLNIPV
jgi:hypothetical protein